MGVAPVSLAVHGVMPVLGVLGGEGGEVEAGGDFQRPGVAVAVNGAGGMLGAVLGVPGGEPLILGSAGGVEGSPLGVLLRLPGGDGGVLLLAGEGAEVVMGVREGGGVAGGAGGEGAAHSRLQAGVMGASYRYGYGVKWWLGVAGWSGGTI